VFANACELGLEDIVSKREDSFYKSLPAPRTLSRAVVRGQRDGPAMNDLSAFDGDGERERQICDLRVRGRRRLRFARCSAARFLTFTGRWIVRRKRR
jgi:hypothetical protein